MKKPRSGRRIRGCSFCQSVFSETGSPITLWIIVFTHFQANRNPLRLKMLEDTAQASALLRFSETLSRKPVVDSHF